MASRGVLVVEEASVRVLISVDMEGVAGVVDPADVTPGDREYESNRTLMTDEANAAIAGVLAYEADAKVLVSDAHAAFRNLLPAAMHPHARLLRGKPKPYGMLAGIDSGVDAAVFIGYHGRAGTARSVLAHTVAGAVIGDVRVNGASLGELGLNAALASHFDVAPVLVAGDDTVAAEAGEVAPGMRTVVVKWALGASAAENLHPSEACRRITEEVTRALRARDDVRPPRFDGPVELQVDVHQPVMVEPALLVPGVERVAGCTVAYRAPDFAAAYRMVQLVALLGGRA